MKLPSAVSVTDPWPALVTCSALSVAASGSRVSLPITLPVTVPSSSPSNTSSSATGAQRTAIDAVAGSLTTPFLSFAVYVNATSAQTPAAGVNAKLPLALSENTPLDGPFTSTAVIGFFARSLASTPGAPTVSAAPPATV